MSDIRQPTEDEFIDFMSWLIDRDFDAGDIDMTKVEITDEPLEFFSEEKLGPMSGEGPFPDEETGGATASRWWDGLLYVADLGDIRMFYRVSLPT
jgi:hypothetical protein